MPQSEATATKLAELADRATDAIAQITTEESFLAWLATAKKFWKYSFMNQLLISIQRPEATRVAGFTKWKELNRLVRKGEKGIAIYAPMVIKDKLDPDKRSVMGFRIAYVFDISQTDGEPLPPGPKPLDIDDDWDLLHAYNDTLTRFLAKEGVGLAYQELHPASHGYYSPMTKKIVINSDKTITQQFKVLLHETAHFLADHKRESLQEAELVAETASYLAASYIGLDTSQFSLPYLAAHAGDVEAFKQHLTMAHKVAQTLATALEDGSVSRTEPQPDTVSEMEFAA